MSIDGYIGGISLPYMTTSRNVVYQALIQQATLNYTTGGVVDNRWRNWLIAYVAQLWLKAFAPAALSPVGSHGSITGSGFIAETIPFDHAVVTLDITNFIGTQSYGSMKYGNYGVVCGVDGAGASYPPQWINFSQMKIKLPANDCVRLNYYFAPGVTAVIETFTIVGNNYIQVSNGGGGAFDVDPQNNTPA